jgi:hypothetical protein
MKVADLTAEEFKEFVKDSVQKALQECLNAHDGGVRLETSAYDLTKGFTIAEAAVSKQKIAIWLTATENSQTARGCQ